LTAEAAPTSRTWGLHAALLLVAALALRAPLFGNPLIQIDEQFYLLVGERMLDGAIPYVDVWDRKPIGLFLIYAGLRWLGGDGFAFYQLAASLFAGATAVLLYRIALRVAAPAAAFAAGIAYLLFLLAFNGAGGQAPVFFNLLVAAAALITLGVVERPQARWLFAKGAAAMLLIGLAIQVKYTPVFEGMFFGLALLLRAWSDGAKLGRLAAAATLWIACALLPTAAALGAYWAIGHGEAFIQANFLSIFGRDEEFAPALLRLAIAVVLLSPFALAIARGRRSARWKAAPAALGFLKLWALTAIGAYLLFGSWYDHYAIPLLLPLGVLAAAGLGWWGRERITTAILLGVGLIAGAGFTLYHRLDMGGRADAEAMAAAIAPRLDGCLFVYEGDPVLYKLTNACWPSPFVFPSHLNNRKERAALPVDVVEETRRILASRPAVVVMAAEPRRVSNLETRAIMLEGLRRDYRLIQEQAVGQRRFLIFAPASQGLTQAAQSEKAGHAGAAIGEDGQ
jgi:hypothetical protein